MPSAPGVFVEEAPLTRLRVLTANDLRQALPMAVAIEAVTAGFLEASSGRAQIPLRTPLEISKHDGVTLVMPAHIPAQEALAVKIVSVFPRNPAQDLPTIHAVVVALDSSTGRPVALIEGASLTALRTGAASGSATQFLARPEAKSLGVFGSGVQARTQIEAVCAVRPVERIRIFSLDPPGAARLVSGLTQAGMEADIQVVRSPSEAATEADILCTATTSRTPVFRDADIRPGTHINAIGAFTPEMAEVDPETVARALIVVDSRSAAMAEAGDLIQPIRQGLITEAAIHAELGEIASGARTGRTGPSQITLFKSVGLAVQDAMAAAVALRRADELGIGQTIEL